MNRIEFMGELENLLSDISDSERKEAMKYYSDYFNDAGPVLKTILVTPFLFDTIN